MPVVDPPYPSFTRMVIKMYSPPSPPLDLSCLPPYRAAHVGRFHPYPRGPRRNTEAICTTAMEYSTPLDPIAEEPEAIVIRPLTVYYEKSPDTDSILSIELDKPVVKDWCTEEPKVPARPTTGIFAAALKMFLRRTRHVLLAMRVFHMGSKK